MNEGIKKFRELLLTDEAFQRKLKTAVEAYDGEKSEEAVFYNVLVPLAEEYGISAAYDEFQAFIKGEQEMDSEELAQIAGGKSGGMGKTWCVGFGVGIGGSGGDGGGGGCVFIGGGWGESECFISGTTTTDGCR